MTIVSLKVRLEHLSIMSARVAVITGSAQGIGKAIAIRLAKDGLKIVVSDVPNKFGQLQEVVQEIQGLGAKAAAVVCDVTVQAEVQKLVEKAVTEFGSVDVVSYPSLYR